MHIVKYVKINALALYVFPLFLIFEKQNCISANVCFIHPPTDRSPIINPCRETVPVVFCRQLGKFGRNMQMNVNDRPVYSLVFIDAR